MRPKAISTKPYADIGRAGKPPAQRRRILRLFQNAGRPLNRRQLAELTGYKINIICWRVNGMIKSGLLKVVDEMKDPVTGQDAEMLFPTPGEVRQMEFSFHDK